MSKYRTFPNGYINDSDDTWGFSEPVNHDLGLDKVGDWSNSDWTDLLDSLPIDENIGDA